MLRSAVATITDILTRLAAGRAASRSIPASSGGGAYWRPFGLGSDTDTDLYAAGIVAQALRVKVSAFADASPRVVDVSDADTDGEPVADHPLAQLWNNPSPDLTRDILEAWLLASFEIDGNAYLIKHRDPSGVPVAVTPVPPWSMTPRTEGEKLPGQLVTYYDYRTGGALYQLPKIDVVHLRYTIDPKDHTRGVSPLKLLAREVLSDERASDYTASMLRNVGVASWGFFPNVPAGASPPTLEQAEAFTAQFQDEHTGRLRGRAFTATAPYTPIRLSMNPSEMNLAALRRIPEERVAGAIGVPPILAHFGAGIEASSGRNELTELRTHFYETEMVTSWRRFGRQLHRAFLPDFPDLEAIDPTVGRHFVYDTRGVEVLQPNRDSEAARYVSLTAGGLATVNESRVALGLEARPDGDVFLLPAGADPTPTFDITPIEV